jgi:hypothetical protein
MTELLKKAGSSGRHEDLLLIRLAQLGPTAPQLHKWRKSDYEGLRKFSR